MIQVCDYITSILSSGEGTQVPLLFSNNEEIHITVNENLENINASALHNIGRTLSATIRFFDAPNYQSSTSISFGVTMVQYPALPGNTTPAACLISLTDFTKFSVTVQYHNNTKTRCYWNRLTF